MGSKVPPMTPMLRSPDRAPIGSAVGVVEKLQFRNPNRFPASRPMPRERVVQAPAVDHPLEVSQSLGIRHVRHCNQSLQLVTTDAKAAVNPFDGERFRRARAAIDLQ